MIAAGGPWTHLYRSIQIAGGAEDLTAEVRDPDPYPVDQPLVTSGAWLGAGDGVLESGLAATPSCRHRGHGDAPGTAAVRGIAETVSRGRFPLSRPAQVWITPRPHSSCGSLA